MLKELNNKMDVTTYLNNGKLTKPFLDNKILEEKLNEVKQKRLENNLDADLVECLCEFVFNELKYAKDENFRAKNQFCRIAEEIYKSGQTTGCTDSAMVFATFARQMGIPTTILHTAQKEWANRFINNLGNTNLHFGHTFCECFVNDKWILVDPTFNKILWKYNSGKPVDIYGEYKVGDSVNFLPYFRGLDLGEKQTLHQHNLNEEIMVKASYSNFLKTENVVKRFYDVKTPEELLDFMDSILTYGFLDTDNNEHILTMKGITNHRVLSIYEIFDWKYETCVEAAKLAKFWFDTNDIECKLFFERIKKYDFATDTISNKSNHFYILFNDKQNGWCRFEQSSSANKGITVFGDYNEAVNGLLQFVTNEKEIYKKYEKELNCEILDEELYAFDEISDDFTYKKIDEKANNLPNMFLNYKAKIQ